MLSNNKIPLPSMRRALLVLLLIVPLFASAQEQEDNWLWSNIDLGEVVVTGTRTPRLLKDVPVQTRVISSKDIEHTDATNIQDLLQTELPGVEFSYAMNQQVNMNLSGFAGQGVLILVNGERLAGETMDNVDFTRLSMSNVEKVEIVRKGNVRRAKLYYLRDRIGKAAKVKELVK